MNGRGTRRSRQVMRALYAVLLFVVLALSGGCRENETGPSASSQPKPFTLSFAKGAQFVYNTWTLDENSVQPFSRTLSTWRVLVAGTSFQGMSGVTIIADSVSTVDGRSDTLYIATSPNGDIAIYGFLARVVKRRLGRDLAPEWNLVASFSGGLTSSWKVGSADSLGEETVYGSFAGASDYFSATVDSVMEVFPTYRVDLAGPTLSYSLWFSDTPNAIVRLLEEPDYQVEGELRELVAIKSGAR
jgi:hypothetical protein